MLLCLSPSSQWDTVPKWGLEQREMGGRKGGLDQAPPSLGRAMAAIGEPSKGDCTTDGHLQATMILFVQPVPSPLNINPFLLFNNSRFPSLG